MIVEVYDVETLYNCFTYVGILKDDDTTYKFVIHDSRNDLDDLYKHLLRGISVHVGYNNENFDYPVLHFIINNIHLLRSYTNQLAAQAIYQEAQRIITSNEYTAIPDKNKFIPQIDLFSIWHYGNKARLTSLKDLQVAMNMPNVEEMPIHHSDYVTSDNIPSILYYNENDVIATKKFLLTTIGQTDYSLYKGKNKIALRYDLKNKFKINCLNYSDVKLGEQLMLNLYSRSINESPYTVKQRKTVRHYINLRDCIPYWCNINSPEFKSFIDSLSSKTIDISKGEGFDYSVIFNNIQFDFGLGGAHGCIKPGVYTADENFTILDLDVASLYPSIAKSLNIYPNHLGTEFLSLYNGFIEARINEKKKPKSERDFVLIEGYKLILNGIYGKSKEITSPFYDPLYTFKTTIAGQLFICMWAERMVAVVPELQFIQINTKYPLVL